MDRNDILKMATEAVNRTGRSAPEYQFEIIAAVLNGYGFRFRDQPLKAHHVAVLMIVLKVARLLDDYTGNPDHCVDIAGYAGCAWECIQAMLDGEN